MEDDIIFTLSIHLLSLVLLDYFELHGFGQEALLSIFNSILVIYFYKKHKKRK